MVRRGNAVPISVSVSYGFASVLIFKSVTDCPHSLISGDIVHPVRIRVILIGFGIGGLLIQLALGHLTVAQ
jgi:hypothetical protein